MSENIGEHFVQEFVIGLGLLGGMGVDPEGMILQSLNEVIKSLNPSMDFSLLIAMLSILVTLGAVLGAYKVGSWVGIVAVGMAFLGGIFINTQFGVWMLVIAIFGGLFAPQTKN
jgi:hypothetical protein